MSVVTESCVKNCVRGGDGGKDRETDYPYVKVWRSMREWFGETLHILVSFYVD